MTYQLAQHQFLELDAIEDGEPLAIVAALARWLQATADARQEFEPQLSELLAQLPGSAALAEDLAYWTVAPELWAESRAIGEWLERVEGVAMAAEGAQLRGQEELAAELRHAVDTCVASIARPDLVLVGELVASATASADRQQRQPWAAIAAQVPLQLPTLPEPDSAAAILDAWALGRLQVAHAQQLGEWVARGGAWQAAYRTSLGAPAILQWRQAFATPERALQQVFLPHLGPQATARFVATRTALVLRWPGHPDEPLTEGAYFWGDSVTGTLRTDVRMLASDVHLAVQEALVLLQGDAADDVQLLEHSAKLLADERLAAPLGRAAEFYREGELDDGGQLDWQVWQIAQLRTELELAVRRVDSAELRSALGRADAALRGWQAQHAFCLLSTEQLEELAELLGGTEGIWWLGALELDDFEVPTGREIWLKPQPAKQGRAWFKESASLGVMADAAHTEIKLAWTGPGQDDASLNAPHKANAASVVALRVWSERAVSAVRLNGVRHACTKLDLSWWRAELPHAELAAIAGHDDGDWALQVEVDGNEETWSLNRDGCVGIDAGAKDED